MYADNIFVEPVWRTVTYEEEYLKAYASAGGSQARTEGLLPVLQQPTTTPDPGFVTP